MRQTCHNDYLWPQPKAAASSFITKVVATVNVEGKRSILVPTIRFNALRYTVSARFGYSLIRTGCLRFPDKMDSPADRFS